jgi:UDP-glucose-4-epimerase GalE
MRVLVIGGAGYIGSHMCKLLAEHGHKVSILDDLSTGNRAAARYGRLVVGDVGNQAVLHGVFSNFKPDAVVHFAGKSVVAESITNPALYYRGNFMTTSGLADYMRQEPGRPLIFSSTAAVYGTPEGVLNEAHPCRPINPYGASKLAAERMLSDYWDAYQQPSITFRYFNAAGADPSAEIGEAHEPETHLIPLIFDAVLGRTGPININGADYATADGTCIRDFVHVNDLCQAHLAGIHKLLESPKSYAFNLGNGKGHSVMQVIQAVERVLGKPVPTRIGPRRLGDPVTLVADATAARRDLQWQPQFADLESIIETAWRWHNRSEHNSSHVVSFNRLDRPAMPYRAESLHTLPQAINQ